MLLKCFSTFVLRKRQAIGKLTNDLRTPNTSHEDATRQVAQNKISKNSYSTLNNYRNKGYTI